MKTDEFYEIFRPYEPCDHVNYIDGHPYVTMRGKCEKCGVNL